ncbi:MAG: extracellular solute-binding protein, partial [Candidatus Latescibacteria bacterium]|nr:extracellular solute-binding protein [Candidatus Latescibacterota bacterium]
MPILFLLLLLLLCTSSAFADSMVYRTHALTLYGDPKYPADFTHFDYVNPDAPKAGQIRLAAIGTYDNLNPFILKGVAAAGSLLLYNRLCTKSKDEPFTEYGQLAQSMQMPTDRSWVIFELHPEARWHDGVAVSAADVIFSFRTLTTQGIPFFRTFYADVDTVFAIDERRVKFQFKEGTNREMPLIAGQLRILPAHYWQDRDFGATTLEPPLGSGPYKIADFEPGRSITYERVEEYWARDIPVHKGRHNFDVIRYEYYRDRNVAIEAFKAGEYDYRSLGNSKEWATDYEGFAPIAEGRMVKEAIPHQLIRGMSGFAFNTRREKFKDRRVRRALAYAYDFEWTNKQLFYGLFDRSRSYWGKSALGSAGLPVGRELEILEEYRGRIPEEVFTAEYIPPTTDGSGQNRTNLRSAKKLLAEAGWSVVDGALTHAATGEVMRFEFLLGSSTHERVLGPVVQNLERLGIAATVRTVDAAQYQHRVKDFDYDIISASWRQTLSPGNEQRNFWSSKASQSQGSRNYAGI